jgi:hypothetical protein
VDEKCRIFAEQVHSGRTRFVGASFANELFALRCPILPVDGDEK